MLNSQDALLGPWLPGRDMLEDELRTFVGRCDAVCVTVQSQLAHACALLDGGGQVWYHLVWYHLGKGMLQPTLGLLRVLLLLLRE